MNGKIWYSTLFVTVLAISFGLFTSYDKVFGKDDIKIPEINKEQRLEIRNKILEAQNVNFQVDALIKQRDQMVAEVNKSVDDLFTQYKVDKTKFTLDLQTIVFTLKTSK